MAASDTRFEQTMRIRFAHCDPAGIVFFPQYLVLFNALVEDWISDELGISYAVLIGRRRVGLPVVSLACEFKVISRMGDEVTLGLAVERVGNRSLTLLLDCGVAGQPRVLSKQVLVTTDLDTHRAMALPTDLREAVARFQGRS